MIDERIKNRYFQGVSAAEIEAYNEFIRQNPKRLYKSPSGKTIAYFVLGNGADTLLVPSGGMGFLPGETSYRGLARLSRSFRVICPDPVITTDIMEMVEIFDGILLNENAGRIFLYGSSGAGLVAQAYFKNRFERIERLVLASTITVTPDQARAYSRQKFLTRFIPAFLLRRFLLKTGGGLLHADVPMELEPRLEFYSRLVRFMIIRHFRKSTIRKIMAMMDRFASEGGLAGPDYTRWQGRALIITAEADPGFKHTPVLKEILPQSQVYTFGKEYGHITAFIAEDEYYRLIERFLK